MLKFVIKRNRQHPATGDIESTFETFEVSLPLIETALDREWGGIKDASVVECRILKESAEASTQPLTQAKAAEALPDGEITPSCGNCGKNTHGECADDECGDGSNWVPA